MPSSSGEAPWLKVPVPTDFACKLPTFQFAATKFCKVPKDPAWKVEKYSPDESLTTLVVVDTPASLW